MKSKLKLLSACNHISRRARQVIQKDLLHKKIGRQKFLIGTIPKAALDAFHVLMIDEHYYHDNPLAYVDDGEAVNVRRLRMNNGKWYQAHVRAFEDGEIRAHYEIAPEQDPVAHFKGTTADRLPAVLFEELIGTIKWLNGAGAHEHIIRSGGEVMHFG